MRRIALSVAAATVLGGVLLAPSQASAASAGCPSTYFCLYSGTGGGGTLLYQSPSSGWHVVKGVRSARNNGVYDPGVDQVSLYDKNANFIACIKRGQTESFSKVDVYSFKWGYWSNC